MLEAPEESLVRVQPVVCLDLPESQVNLAGPVASSANTYFHNN